MALRNGGGATQRREHIEGALTMNTDVSIIDTAMQGWRDAASAREKMPNLFWIAIGILVVLGILHVLIGGYFPVVVSIVLSIAQALALTPLAIAVHRFVLLGEARDAYDFAPGAPRFQRFFMFTIALEILGAIPSILAIPFLVIAPFLYSLIVLVLAIGVAIVAVRTVMLFPSIAIDSAGADWRNAMADAKGHSWRIFFTLLCTVLPAMVLEAVLVALFSWGGALSAIVFAFVIPVITVFVIAAVAASASRLFAAYANQLGRPSNLYSRATV
jgi:hypothetical protein